MNYNINIKLDLKNIDVDDSKSEETFRRLNDLKKKFLDLTNLLGKQEEKVAYYYEDLNTGSIASYNSQILFYAASSIKVLVCLLLLEKAEKKLLNLEEKILVTMDDLKRDTGIIKYQKQDTYYTLEELIRLTIVESDNTAYIKLVNYVGKEELESYGKSLGALHTLEGKDLFGLINCDDMAIYWKKVKNFIDNSSYGKTFYNWLTNPSFNIVDKTSIGNNSFVKKYGSWEIAYHEAGYVASENPFLLIILTQKNKCLDKEQYVNEVAKLIYEMHKIINFEND